MFGPRVSDRSCQAELLPGRWSGTVEGGSGGRERGGGVEGEKGEGQYWHGFNFHMFWFCWRVVGVCSAIFVCVGYWWDCVERGIFVCIWCCVVYIAEYIYIHIHIRFYVGMVAAVISKQHNFILIYYIRFV